MQNMNKTLAPQNLSEGSDKMLEVTDKNNNMPVLNMLNTKYLIVGPQGQQPIAVRNKSAMGNAWFVNKVDYVDNANEEMDGIGKIDLHHEAVADKKFEQFLGKSAQNDSTATATLVGYEPNNLTYDVNSKNGGVVVFSEIYYRNGLRPSTDSLLRWAELTTSSAPSMSSRENIRLSSTSIQSLLASQKPSLTLRPSSFCWLLSAL